MNHNRKMQRGKRSKNAKTQKNKTKKKQILFTLTVSLSSGTTVTMMPVADRYSNPSLLYMSTSSRQPSSSGNSEDVTVTPEPTAQELLAGVGEEGATAEAEGLSAGAGVVKSRLAGAAVGASGAEEVGVGLAAGVAGAGVTATPASSFSTPSHPQTTTNSEPVTK